MDKKIFFHEDDYLQIEILPAENAEFCKKQMADIDDFANEHKTETGYKDIFVRKDSALKSLKECGIRLYEIEKLFLNRFEISSNVFTGYGSYEEKCENTKAVYKDEYAILFFSCEDGVVNHIWLSRDMEDIDSFILSDALCIISELRDLIIADYDFSEIVDLKNKEDIDKYIALIKEAYSD